MRNGSPSFGLAQQAQHTLGLTVTLQHLAAVAILSGKNDASSSATLARGALLLGYVDACAIQLGVIREYTEQQEYDRVRAALRAAVPADQLAQLMAQGAKLTPEQAIELALSI